MNAIEIARRLAQVGETADAQKAYLLALANKPAPEEELEAAVYLLETQYDYRVAYTSMQKLYNAGQFREMILPVMTEAFYLPNIEDQQRQYRRNCRALEKYPYLFRRDLPQFEDLPLRFYPFDDNGYIPFDVRAERFGEYVDPNHPEVTHYFFQDLEKPILATDIYSQYELEYLNDNVRRSEWCARENHIYLHYTSWEIFCAWLCVIDWRGLLKDQKFVFLIEDEKELYPIDFKQRFGIDYSQYTVKPFGIREVNKLIWHTQLSSHNGGDFFNEVLYGHPNLLTETSIMMSKIEDLTRLTREGLRISAGSPIDKELVLDGHPLKASFFQSLRRLRDVTDKDIMIALFLHNAEQYGYLDPHARIAPALLLQPHFPNIIYTFKPGENGVILRSKEYETIRDSALFRDFKYIKTFTPLRRPTTSYGAAIKFMHSRSHMPPDAGPGKRRGVIGDDLSSRIVNRSFMVDWQNRLFTDSRLVRFEDGKLNPKATFTALAAFLDIPYTDSMTYCSAASGRDPESYPGNARGFDPAAVYRTYDEYADDTERCFLEYFMRDVYERYGYDFRYYDGCPVDEQKVEEWLNGFSTLDHLIRNSMEKRAGEVDALMIKGQNVTKAEYLEYAEKTRDRNNARRRTLALALMNGLVFVNQIGQPLRFMTPLQLDPALLEQPLYR